MPWKKISLHKYERPYDGSEQMVRAFTSPFKALKRTHWNVNLSVQTDFKRPMEEAVSLLRSAWTTIRYAYPFVAADSDEKRERFKYLSPGGADLRQWLDASAIIHLEGQVKDLLLSPGLVQNSCLRFFQSSGTFVFHFHHYLIDSTGIRHVVNRFFQYLCGDSGDIPTFGDERIQLSPSPAEAAG